MIQGQNTAKSGGSVSYSSTTESLSTKRPWQEMIWKQGDKCRAPWSSDQK